MDNYHGSLEAVDCHSHSVRHDMAVNREAGGHLRCFIRSSLNLMYASQSQIPWFCEDYISSCHTCLFAVFVEWIVANCKCESSIAEECTEEEEEEALTPCSPSFFMKVRVLFQEKSLDIILWLCLSSINLILSGGW
jgi:hypothetical protein